MICCRVLSGKIRLLHLRVFCCGFAGVPTSSRKRESSDLDVPIVCRRKRPMLPLGGSRHSGGRCGGRSSERLGSCRETYIAAFALHWTKAASPSTRQCGEIVARGSLVSGGYHNLPEARPRSREHGWHHTGDIVIWMRWLRLHCGPQRKT